MAFPKYRAAGIIDGADWDAFVLAMVAHSLRHALAGVDPIITPLDAGALALTTHGDIVFSGAGNLLTRLGTGNAGDLLQSGGAGADLSWVAAGLPGAHEATHVRLGVDDIDSALDARAVALAAQGEIVYHAAGANTLAALAVGVAGQALVTGGPAANPSWAAPVPVAHEATHVAGGADDIDSTLDGRAIALTTQGDVVYASGVNTITRLAAGVAGQMLLTGGPAANPYWGGASGGMPIFIAAPNPDGNTGRHAGQLMADGVDILVGMDFVLPYNFDIATWSVDAIIIPEGTGDMRRSVATDFGLICANEQKDANSDTIAAGEVAVTADEIECLDITGALAGSTALDLVGLEFTREGSHINDNVGAACYFIGVVIRPP